jgi:hypothetical protein
VPDGSEIASACEQRLSFLVERHGFEPPQVERIGRETYMRFHRGNRTVSIAWEPGLAPVVEIFEPPQSPTDKVESWAERNGVARMRRFPRVRTTSKFEPNDRSQLDKYFGEVGEQLQKEEESWLAT